LFVADSATDDSVAEVAAARLVSGGPSTSWGYLQLDATGQQATVVDRAETLHIYPE